MLRKRRRGGPDGPYYVRGTVKVGAETRLVKEHSSGLRDEALAETYRGRLQTEIENDLLFGRDGRTARLTFADIGQLYLDREQGLHPNDVWRIGELNAVLGDYLVRDIRDGWQAFRAQRCTGLKPATVDRFRATLQAALHYAAGELDFPAPRIKGMKISNRRIRFLTIPQADRLVASYADHVQPIIRMLRLTGCRTQEALQLQIPHVDLAKGTIFFERTKSGKPRMVKIHDNVAADIARLLEARENPEFGHVFLNRLGEPYADTRDYRLPGGNPLASAHRTALKRAKVQPIGGDDFRIHDWRHHWACHCVMQGVDLITIRELGGWKDLRMVERYAAVSTEHQAAAVAKLR